MRRIRLIGEAHFQGEGILSACRISNRLNGYILYLGRRLLKFDRIFLLLAYCTRLYRDSTETYIVKGKVVSDLNRVGILIYNGYRYVIRIVITGEGG